MPYEKPINFKISSSIPKPLNEQVDHWAAVAGFQKGQFISLLIQLGMQAWLRVYAPEKLLSPDEWARIVKAVGDEEKKQ
jgi:hypothetical protein